MGSPCLFIRQRALKMGYFYWLCVKNSNHFHTEDTKLYLESKASSIDISSIASFKLFLVAWLREYCTFSDSSVFSFNSWPWPKYIQQGTIFQKKYVLRYRVQFEGNLLRFARAHAHVRVLMTRKLCAVGMRNAILRNYLKVIPLKQNLH